MNECNTGPKLKLTDEVMQKAVDYVNGGYIALAQVIPSGEGLARHLGVVRKTLYNWRERNSDFDFLMDSMNDEQAVKCLNHGLTGKFTPQVTKLILNRHGYHDKIDTDVTSKGDKITRIEVVGIGNSED